MAQDGTINVKHVLYNCRIIYGIEGSQILKVFSTCKGGRGSELNREENIYWVKCLLQSIFLNTEL